LAERRHWNLHEPAPMLSCIAVDRLPQRNASLLKSETWAGALTY
jgi:hypothetical protein